MNRNTFRIFSFLFFTLLFFPAVNSSSALTISQYKNFNFSAPGTSTLLGMKFDTVNLFDTSLGALNSVNVSIQGSITSTGPTAPYLVTSYLIPTPYSLNINAQLNILGLPGLFNFSNPLNFTANQVATGAGDSIFLFNNFSIDFEINELTDSFGGTVIPGFYNAGTYAAVPPASISGTLNDFTAGVMSSYILQTYADLIIPSPFPQPFMTQMNGNINIDYSYTPYVTQSVPEPTSIVLLLSTFTGIGIFSYRKNRK